MKVIGFRKSSFKGNDGSEVSGINLYLTEPADKGEGLSCERVYVLDKYLNACGYVPKLGDEVRLEYNRYGKCAGVHQRPHRNGLLHHQVHQQGFVPARI